MPPMADQSNMRQSFNSRVTGMKENLFPSHSSGVEVAAVTSSKQREFLFSSTLSIFVSRMPFFGLLS